MSAQQQKIPAKKRMSPFVYTILGLCVILIVGLAISMSQSRMSPDEITEDATSSMFPAGTEATKLDETKLAEAKSVTYIHPTDAEIAAAKAAGTRRATIVTDRGTIVCELDGKEAPLTVANFVKLAQAKFYDGLLFHRVVPGFVIQGGDPEGTGMGGPGYAIKREISPKLRHIEGALAMARSKDPDSAGSQFYITLSPTAELDDEYAVFGKVVKGLDVTKKITVGDTIKSITIE